MKPFTLSQLTDVWGLMPQDGSPPLPLSIYIYAVIKGITLDEAKKVPVGTIKKEANIYLPCFGLEVPEAAPFDTITHTDGTIHTLSYDVTEWPVQSFLDYETLLGGATLAESLAITMAYIALKEGDTIETAHERVPYMGGMPAKEAYQVATFFLSGFATSGLHTLDYTPNQTGAAECQAEN